MLPLSSPLPKLPATPAARPVEEASRPSGATSAASAASSGAIHSDVFEGRSRRGAAPAQVARCEEPGPTGPVDGRAFMQDAIADIRSRVAAGEPVKVVFDMDDTLWDNRGRTLALAKEFDQLKGTHLFDSLELGQVGKDGYETARNLGLSKQDARAFSNYYWDHVFTPGYNQYDLPNTEIQELARQAKEAGAEVVYLTGRNESEREGSLAELQRFGLPDADNAHLVMKPKKSDSTPDYKVERLNEWISSGDAHYSWFITESRRDLSAVQRAGLEIPTVLIDHPKERKGEPVDPSTPIFPSQVDSPAEETQILWVA